MERTKDRRARLQKVGGAAFHSNITTISQTISARSASTSPNPKINSSNQSQPSSGRGAYQAREGRAAGGEGEGDDPPEGHSRKIEVGGAGAACQPPAVHTGGQRCERQTPARRQAAGAGEAHVGAAARPARREADGAAHAERVLRRGE
eukprot:7005726-Pyramimonas_sp.AAC.1